MAEYPIREIEHHGAQQVIGEVYAKANHGSGSGIAPAATLSPLHAQLERLQISPGTSIPYGAQAPKNQGEATPLEIRTDPERYFNKRCASPTLTPISAAIFL